MNPRRWWISWIVGALGVTLAIVLVWGFSGRTNPHAGVDQFEGTWVSTNKDAPGTLVLSADGTAESIDLTIYDRHADPMVKLAEDLSARGSWVLVDDNLAVSLGSNAVDRISVLLLVYSSPFQGTTIQALVGDPDGPRLEQIFRRD